MDGDKFFIMKIPMWSHGTYTKNWKDSGWVYDGIFFPCEYTDDPHGDGLDKVIGRCLNALADKQNAANPDPERG